MIISKVGIVAYNLKLLDNSRVHLVFHVSQLKKAIGTIVVQPTLHLEFEGDKME